MAVTQWRTSVKGVLFILWRGILQISRLNNEISKCRSVQQTSTHQITHRIIDTLRIFLVLSRSRKPWDFSFWTGSFSTCGKTELAPEQPQTPIRGCLTKLRLELLTLSARKMTSGACTRFSWAADLTKASASCKRPRDTNQRGDSGTSLVSGHVKKKTNKQKNASKCV